VAKRFTRKTLSGLHGIYESSAVVERHEAFSFLFKYESLEFKVSGPFYKSPSLFKQEVSEQFKAIGGTKVRGARKHLNYRLTEYLATVAKINKHLNLAAPPSWRDADEHFRWLVDYQIPPCNTYRQIARNVKKDESTVREGIRRSASLIGLTLRSSHADKRVGRPKGARDKKPRRRAESARQKLRGN
jgi:hypothetical protein